MQKFQRFIDSVMYFREVKYLVKAVYRVWDYGQSVPWTFHTQDVSLPTLPFQVSSYTKSGSFVPSG